MKLARLKHVTFLFGHIWAIINMIMQYGGLCGRGPARYVIIRSHLG